MSLDSSVSDAIILGIPQ